jgi:S-adenosylmethionine:tRNA ribosyltransferase-isomerase
MFKLSEFDYKLPKELIAQEPMRPRDYSRLLVLDRKTGRIQHKYFYDIGNYLHEGDVLVLNNSKVFPARLIGKKKGTEGKIEVFLHKKIRNNLWQCLIGGPRRKEGQAVEFECELKCQLIKDNNDGTWEVEFNKSGDELIKIVSKIGKTPLPPYIKRGNKKTRRQEDKEDYQTVYADDKKSGSVAAPTAGFHFTNTLIKKLKDKGVQFEYITLHIGLGTFAPVKTDNIKKHKIHAEYAEIKKSVLQRIVKAKQEGRRVIAVGTTSVRTLEAVFSNVILEEAKRPIGSRRDSIAPFSRSRMTGFSSWIDTFIYPPYKFRVVDAMITNFHLPKSTLLMLVSAFTSHKWIFNAYQEAIEKKYRFYSYGDAMIIV